MAWGPEDSPRVIAPPPLVYLGVLCAGVALDRSLRVPPLPVARSRAVTAGSLIFAAGAALALAATAQFKRAGTNVVPNRPATALVTTGLFRRSRNPGYIGQTLMYLGLAVGARSASAFSALAPLLWLIDQEVVAREERYLERKFGSAFRSYMRRVPRWL